MTAPQSNRQPVAAWLAAADPHPHTVHLAWARQGLALIPLGRRFDAIRVPAERVHAAVGGAEPEAVAAFLADWLDGPVIRDVRSAFGPYYVLVATDAAWHGAEERLSTNTLLGVPRLGHPLTMLTRWVVPPSVPGDLCDPAQPGRTPDDGRPAADGGAVNPTDVDLDERATRIYADYLAHLSSCPYCQRTDYCTVGDRVRRAWKAAQGAAARAHRK